MPRFIDPPDIHAPVAPYAHAVETGPGRRLIISGQLGIRPDGSVPEDAAGQAEQAWANLLAVLAHAGYRLSDVVRLRLYATRTQDLPALRAVRDRHLGDHRPASTFVVVASLVGPQFLFEIEGEAVKD
jgi:2-iminobutanoate/2-iminopropanoate deaminase